MEIIIAHSHLNPGGVTRIIESQIESLKGCSVRVVVGDCQDPGNITRRGAELSVLNSLNYLENRNYSDGEAEDMLEKIFNQLKSLLKSDSVLHFHNLNLGKNPVVTYAVYLLAKKGYKVFNHAHDFAEDRPANYRFLEAVIKGNFKADLKEVLYPDIETYQFGVLNSFDYERLIQYGISKERILWIPNPVTFSAKNDVSDKSGAKSGICKELALDPAKLLVTYPVRVIKRKNIGEFILLAEMFHERANFVVTQPPQNPVEIGLYRKWVNFCKKEKINVVFEAGTLVDFEKLIIGSDFCITTSYQEGFGMVYLEPWLLNTPVVGRDIDYISRDFKADGFEFPALYSKIVVDEKGTDFKDLSMEDQMRIILNVKTDPQFKAHIFKQNPVSNLLFKSVSETEMKRNVTIIKNKYSLEGYGIKLKERYRAMVG